MCKGRQQIRYICSRIVTKVRSKIKCMLGIINYWHMKIHYENMRWGTFCPVRALRVTYYFSPFQIIGKIEVRESHPSPPPPWWNSIHTEIDHQRVSERSKGYVIFVLFLGLRGWHIYVEILIDWSELSLYTSTDSL